MEFDSFAKRMMKKQPLRGMWVVHLTTSLKKRLLYTATVNLLCNLELAVPSAEPSQTFMIYKGAEFERAI